MKWVGNWKVGKNSATYYGSPSDSLTCPFCGGGVSSSRPQFVPGGGGYIKRLLCSGCGAEGEIDGLSEGGRINYGYPTGARPGRGAGSFGTGSLVRVGYDDNPRGRAPAVAKLWKREYEPCRSDTRQCIMRVSINGKWMCSGNYSKKEDCIWSIFWTGEPVD